MHNEQSAEAQQQLDKGWRSDAAQDERRAYNKPTLKVFGQLTSVTLGNSPVGAPDSTIPPTFKRQ